MQTVPKMMQQWVDKSNIETEYFEETVDTNNSISAVSACQRCDNVMHFWKCKNVMCFQTHAKVPIFQKHRECVVVANTQEHSAFSKMQKHSVHCKGQVMFSVQRQCDEKTHMYTQTKWNQKIEGIVKMNQEKWKLEKDVRNSQNDPKSFCMQESHTE